ncbi:hypothetical protein [Acinetobacter sp.]|uniref:hypothetical protein n=1 Tax=Acinetobacter sp. TaxID=472 RepID=UPI002FCB4930
MEPITQNFENNSNRNRAWRRKINYLHRGRDCRHTSTLWKPEKNWKLLWSRSLKISRAKQLAVEYPRISSAQRLKQAQFDFWITVN